MTWDHWSISPHGETHRILRLRRCQHNPSRWWIGLSLSSSNLSSESDGWTQHGDLSGKSRNLIPNLEPQGSYLWWKHAWVGGEPLNGHSNILFCYRNNYIVGPASYKFIHKPHEYYSYRYHKPKLLKWCGPQLIVFAGCPHCRDLTSETSICWFGWSVKLGELDRDIYDHTEAFCGAWRPSRIIYVCQFLACNCNTSYEFL